MWLRLCLCMCHEWECVHVCDRCSGDYKHVGECVSNMSVHPSTDDNSPSWVDMVLKLTRSSCSHNFTGPSELPWERSRMCLLICLFDCETLYKSPHCAKNGRKKNQKIRKVKSEGEIMFPQPPHNQNLSPLVSFLQVLCPRHRFSLRLRSLFL